MKIQTLLFALIFSLALVSAADASNNYCIGDSVYKDLVFEKCNMNCMFGTCLDRQCSDYTMKKLIEICHDGCSAGKCNLPPKAEIKCSKNSDCNDYDSSTKDKCINPGKISSRCENKKITFSCYDNSDCGTDSYVGDKFCKDDNVYKKYKSFLCEKSSCLSFSLGCYFGSGSNKCSSKTSDILIEECELGCELGECKQEEEVECTKDSECGENDWLGNKYCKDGDVKKDFITYKCKNAGTTNSYCSSSTNPELIEDCETGCEAGSCTTLPQIECSKNSDCGTDSYVGDKFCEGNSVFRNLKSFKCNNPGTSASSCSNSVIKVKEKDCLSSEICQSGACVPQNIICSKDADCGTGIYVGDAFCSGNALFSQFKQFKCLNPGTAKSFCTDDIFDKLLWNCPVYCDAESDRCVSCKAGEQRSCSSSKCLYGAYQYCQPDGSYGSCVCNPAPACKDGKDNDGDGKYDYPADPQCFDKWDNDESK